MRTAGVLLATLAVVVTAGALAGPSAPVRAEPEARALGAGDRQLVGVPEHTCTSARELWFRAVDGTRLVGHRFGGKRPGARIAVVLAHQSNGDLCEWAPYARRALRQRCH